MIAQPESVPPIRHLGFVQLRVVRGETYANLERLRQILVRLNPPSRSLIVLPELWATGFAYSELPILQNEVATLPNRLQELAERYDILLAGSLPERAGSHETLFFNTLSIIGGKGIFGTYRKQQIFPGEEQAFCPWSGVAPPIATPAGTFGCLICYDVRFPDLARRQCQQGADMLLCSAEWPSARIEHWRTLVIARAIENQTFMVGCNGIGKNGELTLGGHSLIVSPLGEVLSEAGEDEEAKIVEIDWQVKRQAQSSFRSFTAAPYQLSEEKIASPEICVAAAQQRAEIGQRVVYVALPQEPAFTRTVEILETARQQGDYLVVGVHVAAEKSNSLKVYAALGCVDRVFDLGKIAPPAEQRLREICCNLE